VEPTLENMEAWFTAGVCAVGMGSKLISKSVMEKKEFRTIENTTRELLRIVAQLKN
jgi:2-dehydro-3-deoxyphosphogluconate aldolase / (4S)-4-hydroxy-2-oxoglutarate aldolase